jgi:hypothetical protein
MNYLEKQIKAELTRQNLILLEGTLESAAQYIEQQNENCDEIYTVRMWIEDTRKNYPGQIEDWRRVCDRITCYFTEQDAMCLDQTGRLPNMVDYVGAAESEDFRDKVGYPVTLETYFRLLMKWYEESRC